MVSKDFDWAAVKAYVDFEKTLRERFPAQAWMLDHDELGPIITKAVREKLDPEVLLGQIQASAWGRSRTDAEQAWDILEGSNPEEAAERLADRRRGIERQATELGATLSDEQLDSLARDAIRSGLDDIEITGRMVEQTTAFEAGQFTASMEAVHQAANANMITISDAEAEQRTRRILSGETTAANMAQEFRERAKSKFPSLADLIGRNTNLTDYFSDHRQVIADMMGEDVDAVDLVGDKRWRAVLGFAAEPGSAPRPMAAHEVERFIRTTDEYYQRPAGQAELANNRLRLQSAMGVR